MSVPTIAESLKYANLQMAAEAFIRDPQSRELLTGEDLLIALTEGNGHASKFTRSQAEEFAENWTVIDQVINTSTGFSGTLFQSKDTGEFVVSIRSTEFIDDAVRDCSATNELEIFETGFAWGQLADLEKWYTETVQSHIPIGGKLAVTGYSLGGHLATAFNMLHAEDISEVYTFNGAGVGTVDSGETLSGLLAQFNDLKGDATKLSLPSTSNHSKRTAYGSISRPACR